MSDVPWFCPFLGGNKSNIKQFRRVFTRYDKLDDTYNAFISLANIVIFMRN